MFRTFLSLCPLALLATQGVADQVLYRYEADVAPYDPAAGWIHTDPCKDQCVATVEGGRFILRWPRMGGDYITYHLRLADTPEEVPLSLWVEWRFRSNNPQPPTDDFCDAWFVVDYRAMFDLALMFSNAVFSFEGGDFVPGLDPVEFHTHRFESLDGYTYRISVDGKVYNQQTDTGPEFRGRTLQMGGSGGCLFAQTPELKVNEWDFVRYGTLGAGETLVSADPPPGSLPFGQYDRFTITFDQPAYVYIDDITVTVSGGDAPLVKATRRREPPDPFDVEDDPRILEIVLDRPMPVGETTTFTAPTLAGENTVAYTVLPPVAGACCTAANCLDSTDADCAAVGGIFLEAQTCDVPRACCGEGGSCHVIGSICCGATGGSPIDSTSTCEGDADGDGLDALCGDACPNDALNDIDGDGLCADVDPCPDLNPNDGDSNGLPDCTQPPIIPAVSAWGMVILALTLAVLGTGARRRRVPAGQKNTG